MQRLLKFYAWDADGVRDDVCAVVVEALGDAKHGVLVVDETGFIKKGTKSAGWPGSTRARPVGSRIPKLECSPHTHRLKGEG